MKKIFAIALALVMVLSMASAFASQCNVGPYDWTCSTSTTNCGKAKVEVVPFVKVNNACGGFDYQVSECASAVNSEKIYYGLKLTVDAYPDAEWFEALPQDANNSTGKVEPSVKVTYTGIKGDPADSYAGIQKAIYAADNDKEKVYFFDAANDEWDLLDEDDGITMDDVLDPKSPYVMSNVVSDASKAKVCAVLESENEFGTATVGDYTVTYSTSARHLKVDGVTYDAVLKFASDDGSVYLYMDEDDNVQKIVAKDVAECTTDAALINDVLASYNLGCGYGLCITEDAVKANFGWDDEVKSCFAWGSKAASIVDAECVVAIPKTGDASVLAWMF